MSDTTQTAELGADPAVAKPPRPRIRFGAIAWGLIVCGTAWLVLSTLSSPQSRADFFRWLEGLNPGSVTLIVVLAIGGFILLQAALGLIRRAQRRHAAR